MNIRCCLLLVTIWVYQHVFFYENRWLGFAYRSMFRMACDCFFESFLLVLCLKMVWVSCLREPWGSKISDVRSMIRFVHVDWFLDYDSLFDLLWSVRCNRGLFMIKNELKIKSLQFGLVLFFNKLVQPTSMNKNPTFLDFSNCLAKNWTLFAVCYWFWVDELLTWKKYMVWAQHLHSGMPG